MENNQNLVIFGANPVEKTNSEGEIDVRIEVLKQVLIEKTGKGINSLYILGGENFSHPIVGNKTTEAEYMAESIKEKLPETSNLDIRLIPYGQETITQMDAFIKQLKEEERIKDNFSMISSWHQLPRAALMLFAETERLPELIPAFNPETPKKAMYNVFNCFAGLGYTSLVLGMRKFGMWQDGGPLIRKIAEERISKKHYSWYNAI